MDVSEFIENPGDRDLPVEKVFTATMFDSLLESMRALGWSGLDQVKERWETDYKGRKIISGFIKDAKLGDLFPSFRFPSSAI